MLFDQTGQVQAPDTLEDLDEAGQQWAIGGRNAMAYTVDVEQ